MAIEVCLSAFGKDGQEIDLKSAGVRSIVFNEVESNHPVLDDMKHCAACGKSLPKSAFSKHKRTTDGLQTECRSCQRVRYYERMVRKVKKESSVGLEARE